MAYKEGLKMFLKLHEDRPKLLRIRSSTKNTSDLFMLRNESSMMDSLAKQRSCCCKLVNLNHATMKDRLVEARRMERFDFCKQN